MRKGKQQPNAIFLRRNFIFGIVYSRHNFLISLKFCLISIFFSILWFELLVWISSFLTLNFNVQWNIFKKPSRVYLNSIYLMSVWFFILSFCMHETVSSKNSTPLIYINWPSKCHLHHVKQRVFRIRLSTFNRNDVVLYLCSGPIFMVACVILISEFIRFIHNFSLLLSLTHDSCSSKL